MPAMAAIAVKTERKMDEAMPAIRVMGLTRAMDSDGTRHDSDGRERWALAMAPDVNGRGVSGPEDRPGIQLTVTDAL